MAKKTIGICYFFDNYSNSGIVNYVYNIISGLKSLEDDAKPAIVVFYSKNAPVRYLTTINYPDIQFILFKESPSKVILQKGNSLIKNLFGIDLYKHIRFFGKVDSLYPYFDFVDFGFKEAKNKIHWMVDFNNKVFPEHYDDGGLIMNKYQEKYTALPERVVLSSNSLLNELKFYYPDYKCDVRILRFASSLPELDHAATDPLLEKLELDVPYFMSPNQFWEHKNQLLVIDAIHILSRQHPELSFKVVFTGSLVVNRGKGLYIDKLKSKIEEYGLDKYVKFLGVIERNDQLLLMKNAVALLQPSLYEGWSTLVEEAKALNQFIILSDLPVHREQISVNVDFFDPFSAEDLAGKMYNYLTHPPEIVVTDYSNNIREFGRSIINALTFP